jgi:hypothetical protein
MDKEIRHRLEAIEQAFVEEVIRVILESGITRATAQQKISYLVAGAWNRLEHRLLDVHVRRKRVSGSGD